jgi:hypothetical protein
MRNLWILAIAIALVIDVALAVQLFSMQEKKLNTPASQVKPLKNRLDK